MKVNIKDDKKIVEIVLGQHINIIDGKEQLDNKIYNWVNCKKCIGKLEEGNIVEVITRNGKKLVVVVGVLKMPYYLVKANKIATSLIYKKIKGEPHFE